MANKLKQDKNFHLRQLKEIARGTRVYTRAKINSITSVGSSIKTVGF